MLYGERAGQVVEVTAEEAVELCSGAVQRAEPVAVTGGRARETRTVDGRETR